MKKMRKSLRRLPLRIAWAGAYQASRGRDFPTHEHDTWELVYYRAGNIVCRIGATDHTVEPGVALLTPPHTPHAEFAHTDYASFSLALHAPADLGWPVRWLDDARRSLHRLCAAAVEEFATRRRRREAMLELLAQQLHIALERVASETALSATETLVRQAETLIHETHAGGADVAEIARQAGVAPATLRRHFARRRGCSPLAYLQRVRLRHALHLLTRSDLTLESIAEVCGYHSASHLSRCVKAAKGESPGRLRRVAGAG